jgi:serine phosphatase RsbU (regulator of sigma subunit)
VHFKQKTKEVSGIMGIEPPARILTIDDDRVVRESIAAYLEDSGYTMFEAINGKEGIEIFRREQPDLVLCDLRMPEVDGLEVLEVITSEAPSVPIIMISGAGLISDVVEALRLGAWDYLVKPITDMEVLEHTVSTSLHRAKLEAENRHYKDELEAANRELQTNLAMLREDQEAGRRVQLQLLPASEANFAGYQFSHLVIPSLYLSGDFLDFFEIDEQHTGFYIADVSGHGASSAFVTIMLKSLVNQPLRRYRTQGDETILSPSKMLGLLNTDVLSANLGKYLTMFYGIVNLTTNELTYGIGGHYPRPILKTTDNIQFLDGEGFPVGLFEWAQFQEWCVPFPPGSTLAMFSDGVLEVIEEHQTAEASDDDDNSNLLIPLVSKGYPSIEQISRDVGLTNVTEAPDDITIFLMQRND